MKTWYLIIAYNDGEFYGVLRSYGDADRASRYAKRCNRFLKHIGSKYVISVSQQSGGV